VLTRHVLTRRADTDGVDAAVVERDYVLAHVVAQFHHARPEDGGRLVFKGGTAGPWRSSSVRSPPLKNPSSA